METGNGHKNLKMIQRWFALLPLVSHCMCATQTIEQKLMKHLLRDYDKLVRPVIKASSSVHATFGMELIQIIQVDNRNQQVTYKVWIRQEWTNMLLTWNSTEWGDVSYLKANGDDVWTPDVVLYDNVANEHPGGIEKFKTQVTMYSNGLHYWAAPAIFTSACRIDIQYFPFDRQTCTLKFGSWTYDRGGINLQADTRPIITSQYMNSSEWEIRKAESKVNSIFYTCCPEPYVDVTFKIIMDRKPLFYVMVVIAPCFILALTILFGFLSPPESGERISLKVTILLAIAVFMEMLSRTLPVNSDSVPKLALFYMVILIESALSLGSTCLILTLHHRSQDNEEYPVPWWIRKCILDNLASKLGYIQKKKEVVHRPILERIELGKKTEGIDNKGYEEKENMIDNRWAFKRKSITYDVSRKKKRSRRNSKLVAMNKISRNMQDILIQVKEQTNAGGVNHEWKVIGIVLDRIFLVVFIITIMISTACIIGPAYYAYGQDV